jgi:hypothetical protein
VPTLTKLLSPSRVKEDPPTVRTPTILASPETFKSPITVTPVPMVSSFLELS